MAGERQTPGLGLTAFWTALSSGWDAGMNANLLLLSALCQLRVINVVTALPGAPNNGDRYIVTTGGNAQSVAVRDNGEWKYFIPAVGFLAYNEVAQRFIVFDGAVWGNLPTLPPIGGSDGGKALAAKADRSGYELVAMGGASGALEIIDVNASTVLDVSHRNAFVRVGTPAASTVTFPPDTFSVGDQVHIRAVGAGQVSCVAGVGVTLNTSSTRKLRATGSTVTAVCVAANVFDLMGEFEALP